MKLRIALFDPYTLALEGIYDSLKSVSDFEIIGVYAEEDAFLHCLEQNEVDIVILDLMLKSIQGFELLENIKNIKSKIKIIIFADIEEDIFYKRAIELGVNAFLRQDTSSNELINAIISVGKGNDIIPDFMNDQNVQKILTSTEAEILRLVADEYTNDRIAKELFISRRTVESHVTNICRKLGVDSRIGAVREALRLNMIQ
jgi:two-component system vancomycin resistance associated response regulator VraR